ncbi:PREDICTED: insulin-like peptide receptor [Ceratosolen solmsi marchali]|uniref:Tyrosine-protein kinase receptor n=1 Tax=Ceratosolen solmsi marchali TaxID=326594 RepID=A0AAJ6YBJ2_9HYME|nr:PREDICTED: insulin-like peptide receptor [Ceratosolen solmsi marchali]
MSRADGMRMPRPPRERRWDRAKWTSACLFFLLGLLLALAEVGAEGARTAATATATAVDGTINSSKRGVCQSIDIRNKVSEFSKLYGCRVIEGFVQILLIDQANDTSYADLVFPELVEITGYLMLYRVQGLRSIGHLFPNLTVIRGHQLFVNYALVAFEMTNLQEIGLHSLTDIMRGSVRFEKNSVLCYADTIDWDIIAKAGKGEHVIAVNKPKNECPVCEKDCPQRSTRPDEKLCWNKQRCQKVCSNKCGERACTPSGDCCHPSCLGGCTGPTAFDCKVCREVIVNNSQCVSSCPVDTYEFLNRRCISQQECRMMRKPRELPISVNTYPYKPFGNRCIIDCPAGYEEVSSNGMFSCKECNGPCLKECPGTIVDSIASAQKLRGCTHIKGNLEIAIRDGQNIVRELEESLSGIEVITGYLKIFRSFPLISLNFLNNLTEIKGQNLEMKDYTLVVLDNQNLQELWNWTTRPPLKIGSKNIDPKVSFHYNPKLCLQTIETLRERTGLKPFTDIEVSSTSNGDKVACNVTEIKTIVTSISSKAAIINWEPFKHHDMRTLLGYVIYSKEAPKQNISMYESRDACGGDGWKVDDVSANDDDKSTEHIDGLADTAADSTAYSVAGPGSSSSGGSGSSSNNNNIYSQQTILAMLKPFTQYAYYVKTYTISTERSGAQSKLQYFTTLPGQPSAVRSLTIYSNASDTLVISWLPPFEPNGNLSHYKVIGKMEHYDPVYLRQRNYCDEPMQPLEHKPVSEIAAEEKRRAEQELEASKQPESGSCACPKREPVQSEKDVYSSIAFENALHNQVYVKRGNNRRRRETRQATTSFMLEATRLKRELNSYQEKDAISHGKKTATTRTTTTTMTAAAAARHHQKKSNRDPRRQSVDIEENGSYVYFERKVPANELNFVMRNLRHFGKYNIMVMACRDKFANPQENECSSESMKSLQTLRMDHADDIMPGTFGLHKLTSNDSSTTIKLQWQEPPQPNGVIVAYQIEYKRVDVLNHKTIVACTTRDKFKDDGYSYILPSLPPGNYSVKVRATSFAGNGAYTEIKYFDIPESNLSTPFWKVMLIVLLCIILLLGACLCAAYFFKKKFMRNVPSMRLIATVNPDYVSTVYIPDEWEVPRKKIQLLKELGNGSFGMVYEGIAKDVVKGRPEMRCAVKTVNENATDRERIEFLNEASVMKGFNTHHVVRLVGVVSQGQPTLVVMELMVNGDLKTYLRCHRPDVCENFSRQPPTLKRILQMAMEIADGMAYLAAKKFVHRDLAARNCMVADDLTVKIGDFGMTRDVYETDYYRKGTKGLLPVRWMAPESLKDGVFTSFSDVWSYGVVLWEMVTLASQPYQGLSNEQVLRYVIDGGVMERPENCPDSLYVLMRQTWNHKATRRPTFIDIEGMLLSEIDVESFERVSFYHSPEGVEARNQNSSQFLRTDKDLELVTLQDLHEDEAEGDEDSPLRQDFGDFSSFEPITSVKNGSSGHFGMEPFTGNSKVLSTPFSFLDLNSSKAPLKAGFDDFDGVSAGSLASSKDTLNLPFVEDSVKSVRNSPFAQKKSSSKGNVSQGSAGRTSLSPQSSIVIAAPGNLGNRPSPSLKDSRRSDPEYENRSPDAVEHQHQPRSIGLRVSFPSMDAIDADIGPDIVPTTMTTQTTMQQPPLPPLPTLPPPPPPPPPSSSSSSTSRQRVARGAMLD